MKIDTDDFLNSIKDSFARMKYIKSGEIPNIDLYMDQVTTFLDEKLKSSARNSQEDEKLVTKTMINNYTKNDVIPPPIKKKYNKDHMFLLIFVYYYKSILQINDIKTLLDPITEDFFGKESGFCIEDVYDEIFGGMKEVLAKVTDDVVANYAESLESFEDAPIDKQEYLKKFYFICALSCDVFVKKLLIEKSVDSLREHRTTEENKYTAKGE